MQLIHRTLETLTVLSTETMGLSVSQLAGILSIPPSSAHRILSCLKDSGFVIQDRYSKRYSLGYKVLSLATKISEENCIINTSKPFMAALEKKINKTVLLYVLEENGSICISYAESRDGAKLILRKGVAINPFASASGKIMLAYKDDAFVNKMLDTLDFPAATPKAITDKKLILEQIKASKERGYGTCLEELQVGINAFSAPVFDYNNTVVAAIVFGVLVRESGEVEPYIEELLACAKEISRSLGQRV